MLSRKIRRLGRDIREHGDNLSDRSKRIQLIIKRIADRKSNKHNGNKSNKHNGNNSKPSVVDYSIDNSDSRKVQALNKIRKAQLDEIAIKKLRAEIQEHERQKNMRDNWGIKSDEEREEERRNMPNILNAPNIFAPKTKISKPEINRNMFFR